MAFDFNQFFCDSDVSWNHDLNFITLIVFENTKYGLEKKMVFETEKLTSKKSELESLLMLMEEREKTLKSLVRTLTVRLQVQESNKQIRMGHDVFYNLDDRILTSRNIEKEIVPDQYIKTPISMVELKVNEIKTPQSHHRIRLRRNTTFSWSYQKLP